MLSRDERATAALALLFLTTGALVVRTGDAVTWLVWAGTMVFLAAGALVWANR